LQLITKNLIRKHKIKGHPFEIIGDNFTNFYNNHLPFELTNAQKRVIKEIRNDLGSHAQMNRLLQGDVGSGKTIVALLCMLIAKDNDFQSCLMAPTEILATQHFNGISELAKDLDIKIVLLTGSTKTAARRKIHEALENGELDILIGTHALLEDKVKFRNLGFAIIDEQHRFGVEQRSKLWKKDAMDILYSGKVTGFCLVSSDSDFTRLATRLREAGMEVIGIGEKKTPHPFIVACDKFIYIEILKKETVEKNDQKQVPESEIDKITKKEIKLISATINDLSDEEGWAFLGDVGSLLQKKQPNFDSRNYGFEKLTPLIKSIGSFEIEQRENPKSRYKLIFVKNK
ncbi:predicted protein, partial [Nematostella vectensis]